MASTYKAYLGEGMGPLKPYLTKFKIPHPGRVGGYFAMNLTMPTVLGWVLGGNVANLADARSSFCRMADQPKGFHEKDFRTFLKDDDALIRASKASWLLLPATAVNYVHAGKLFPEANLLHDLADMSNTCLSSLSQAVLLVCLHLVMADTVYYTAFAHTARSGFWVPYVMCTSCCSIMYIGRPSLSLVQHCTIMKGSKP